MLSLPLPALSDGAMALYSPRRWVFNSIKPPSQPGLFIYVMVQPLCPRAPGRVRWTDGHGDGKRGTRVWSLSDLLNHPGVQRAEMAGLGALGMPCPHGPLPAHVHFLALVLKGRLHQWIWLRGGPTNNPLGAGFGASRPPREGKHPGWGWGQTSKERGHVGDHSRGHRPGETRGEPNSSRIHKLAGF